MDKPALSYPTRSAGAGFCPVVLVQRWRSRSAVLTDFPFLRRDPAARNALYAGQPWRLPPMSAASRQAGLFAVLVPERTGCLWLLASTHWRRPSAAEAERLRADLTAAGGPLVGREVTVRPLPLVAPEGGA